MLKIKIISILSILILVGTVLSISHSYSTSAKGDVVQEIANYKTWSKITKEPIKIVTQLQVDGESGREKVFIVDGQEITNFRTGVLSG